MSPFAAEFDAAAGLLDEQFGEPVTLIRGSASTPGVKAVRMSPDAVVLQLDQSATEIVEVMWLVEKTAYLFSGVLTVPRVGDTVTDAAGAVWEILPKQIIPSSRSTHDGTRWVLATRRVE